MSFTIYDASVPAFASTLGNMRAWLDKAESEGDPAALVEARLIDDMKPLTAQYQFASDSAKNAVARLLGIDPPAMPDTETSFAELRERCDKTIAFLESVDPAAFAGSEDREVSIKFPNGMGYRFTGGDYLRRFALPNFYFHATMAYAILRAQGVSLGKPDYLQHLGMPEQL
ncbi:MAG TPA: DUF1993 domain-containing protein [Croceibacterium sp.]|nr:DUF1993 domain-containing protein [Croceibacterium sp.]